MKELVIIVFLAFVFCLPSAKVRASSQVIDFRLSYPFPQFSESAYRVRQKNYAGLDLTYQFYLNDRFSWVLSPGAYFVPIRIRSENAMFFNLFFLTGAGYRINKGNYFDPMICALSGASYQKAGAYFPRKITYPVGGRVSFNLYRQTEFYQDSELALTFVSNALYYLNRHRAVKGWMLDVGLALRGSF